MNTIHKPSFLVVLQSLILSLIIALNISYIGQSDAEAALQTENPRTALVIENSTSEAIEAAVVLAALGGACGAGNPPVTANQLETLGFCSNVINSANPPYAGKCKLTIESGAFVTFPDIPNTCISGNVTFGDYPGCPNTAYPTGFTTAEFTLNTDGGDEVIDISLVNGHNYKVSVSTHSGGAWTYGQNPATVISQIISKPLGENIGNPGVYPEGCTDCIQLIGGIVCPNFSLNPDCQSSRICNVSRSVANRGGTVTVSYMGK